MESSKYYIPGKQINTYISEPQIWRWFNNIAIEVEEENFTELEKEGIVEYYKEAGLMRTWRRNFFRHHFSFNLVKTVNYLFSHLGNPKILDLGCGIGTQSILFAILGAEVISVDLDHLALDILRKRKELYQRICKRELNISIYEGNAFEIDYNAFFPLDGVFSMFAFNMMQPSNELLNKIIPILQPGGRFVIFDGNCSSWIPKIMPSRRRNVLSPVQLSQYLEKSGLTVSGYEGCIAIPPIIWALIPDFILTSIDNLLAKSLFFSVSYQVFANRGGQKL